MLKKGTILLLLTALLLLGNIPTPCLAGEIDLELNMASARVGNNVTISGRARPETWVSIKIIDNSTNIVFFETVATDSQGSYELN
jgi:hypothetical protein